MHRLNKNNSGYSLVELIIVVAIITALAVAALWSAAIIFGTNARTCANDIVNAMAECKVKTMSYGEGNLRLIIYQDDKQNVYCELQAKDASGTWDIYDSTKTAEKIGNSRCLVSSTETGSSDLSADRNNPWIIAFNRGSGSFRYNASTPDSSTSVDDIFVRGGGRKYHIALEKLTGKTTLEMIP